MGIELWSMSSDILFDNIVVTDEESHADEWASQTYDLKKKQLDNQAVSIPIGVSGKYLIFSYREPIRTRFGSA